MVETAWNAPNIFCDVRLSANRISTISVRATHLLKENIFDSIQICVKMFSCVIRSACKKYSIILFNVSLLEKIDRKR